MSLRDDELPVARAAELAERPAGSRWLIEGLWARAGVGILGGQPKCGKSWLGLEMATAVASATACLSAFPVADPGPALVYLAEDALPDVRTRIEALAAARGRALGDLDLHVITAPALRLDLEGDRQRLLATLQRIQPRLVVLDPLVRLHRLDENSSAEVSGLLGFLREIQRRFDLAVVVVHHASKRARAHPGQALRGSSDLHAWGDSNAYLARDGQGFVLTLEHRAAPAPEPLRLGLTGGTGGMPPHLVLAATSESPAEGPGALASAVVTALRASPEPLTRGALREQVRVNNERLGQTLAALEEQGILQRTPAGWTLDRQGTTTDADPAPHAKNAPSQIPLF